jgi:hypothetical protein
MVAYSKPSWGDAAQTQIFLTVHHDATDTAAAFDEPFQSTKDAPGLSGQIFSVASSGGYGTVAPYAPPPPPVPQEVTLAQARAALLGAGLFTQVDQAIKNSGNPIAAMAWEYTNMVDRNGALVTSLGPATGLTSAQIDALFIAAAAIKL